jgi:hypothetical protein
VPFLTISARILLRCSSASARRAFVIFSKTRKERALYRIYDESTRSPPQGAGIGGGNDEREQT